MNHILLPITFAVIVFGLPVAHATKKTECPKTHDGEKLAYSTIYPDGSVRCTYVPNIIGLSRREG